MSTTTTEARATRPALDVQRVRDDFPILKQRVHGKPLVYFDNAASSQKPRAVIDAIRHYYEADHANVHRAAHALSERATEAYEEARAKVMRFLHAPCVREIIFTRGTTEAVNLVAQTFGRVHVHAGDEVVISALEHHSNIVPWQVLCQEKHASLRVVPVTDEGELRLDEFEGLLNPSTKLVAVAHVSNSLGTVTPVKRMIEIAHRRGIPVFVDGAQAVPHLRVDVQELDCDFYAFSAHKVYGPTGVGVLYGKGRHLERMPPYQTGGDMISHVSFERTTWNELPYKFEAGTPNIAGVVGLGAAVDYVTDLGRDAIAAHERELLRHATERLRTIPGVRVVGTAKDKAGVLSFVVEDPPLSALDVGSRLDLEGIAIRTGHHCCQPLMDRFGIAGTARASFAAYNTLKEVDAFADALEKIVAAARPRTLAVGRPEPAYPGPAAPSPQEAADELADVIDFIDDREEQYRYIEELGTKLPPMPEELKTDENRVRGCQATVFVDLRKRPGTDDAIEFLAASDAHIVNGLLAVLQRVFSGQSARKVLAFDVEAFVRRLGLERFTMSRRIGLDAMIKRVRGFAAAVAAGKGSA